MRALSEMGQEGLYSSDISVLKTTLSNLVMFNVYRYNVISGSYIYLGMFNSGQFMDDGLSTPSAPNPGMKYWYVVEAVLISPFAASNALKNKFFSSAQQLANSAKLSTSLRNPTTYSNLQAQTLPEIINPGKTTDSIYRESKSQKNYSKKGMTRGTVPTVNDDPLSDFPTGDGVIIEVSTGRGSIEVKNPKVTISKRSGPVVRWKISRSSGEQLDSFVVLATKQGKRYVAGVCHALDTKDYIFVDSHNRNFVGTIQYHVAPIFLSGGIGMAAFAGSVAQRDKNIKYRRGR